MTSQLIRRMFPPARRWQLPTRSVTRYIPFDYYEDKSDCSPLDSPVEARLYTNRSWPSGGGARTHEDPGRKRCLPCVRIFRFDLASISRSTAAKGALGEA